MEGASEEVFWLDCRSAQALRTGKPGNSSCKHSKHTEKTMENYDLPSGNSLLWNTHQLSMIYLLDTVIFHSYVSYQSTNMVRTR